MVENQVFVTLDEYTDMVATIERYNMLIDSLLDAAALDYSGKSLTIYSGTFDTVMKICLHDTYMARLHELQREGEKNATD